MFTKQLEQIFIINNLNEAFLDISSKSTGLDEISYSNFKYDLSKNLEDIINDILKGTYSPEPLKKIEIEKENSTEKRPIALSSIKDKIIQKNTLHRIKRLF